jgi:hypothetical protein
MPLVYTDRIIPSVYTGGIVDDVFLSANSDMFFEGIISVGKFYRRNFSVCNSVGVIRFSGSVIHAWLLFFTHGISLENKSVHRKKNYNGQLTWGSWMEPSSPPNILLVAAFSFIDYMHKIECSQSIYVNFLIICIKSSFDGIVRVYIYLKGNI